jgi:hypothetical protein
LELPAKINQMKMSDQHEGLVSDRISRLAVALVLVLGGGENVLANMALLAVIKSSDNIHRICDFIAPNDRFN